MLLRAKPGTKASEVLDAEVVNERKTVDIPFSQGIPPPAQGSLLRALSWADRGANTTDESRAEVEGYVSDLEAAAELDPSFRLEFPADLEKLEGRWRLLYTSAFAVPELTPRSTGRLETVLPSTDNPFLEVGDILQEYRINDTRADTVLELRPPKWLRGSGLLEKIPFLSADSGTSTRLTLSQSFSVDGNSTLRFAFADGQVASELLEQLGTLKFPLAPLGMSEASSSSPFTDTLTTTYCDGEVRIGRGGRFGELRIFQRVD